MTDRRVLSHSLAAALALATLPQGVAAYENRSTPFVAPDGSGGIYVLEYRISSAIWLQHFLASGAPAIGYPREGLPVDTIPSPSWRVMDADGLGGAIIAYRSSKTGGNGIHVSRAASQIAPAPGWPANGVPGYLGPVGPGVPGIASDGTGGLLVAWQDFRLDYNDQDIYVQRIDGSGARAAGWPDTAIAVCDVPGDQYDPVLLADGAGGCFAAWYDGRNRTGPGDDNFDIYAQRVGPDGTRRWPAGGIAISRAPGFEDYPTLAGDGAGGVYVSWTGATIAIPEVDYPATLQVHRVTADGAPAPGWPTDGLSVALISRYRNPGLPLLVGDGAGGAYVAWGLGMRLADGERSTVRILRLAGNGTVAGGWPTDGIDLESGSGHLGPLGLLSDGQGGAVVGWRRLIGDTLESIRLQRVDPSGAVAAGWPKAGIALGLGVIAAQLVTDGAGGVTMHRQLPGTGAARVTRVTKDGVVDPGWPGYPTHAGLFPPYPQPASEAVSIPFALPALSPLEAKVYDITGRRVRDLIREPEFAAGRHTLTWDGRDEDGRRVPGGVYVVRVRHAGGVASTRVVLAR